jgi:hypothetical protein
MKRYLSELSDEELLKVYEVNTELNMLVSDEVYECEYEYVRDLLNHLEENDAITNYSVDINSSNNFIVVKDSYEFFQNIESVLYNFGIDEPNEALLEEARDGMQWCIAKDSVELYSQVYEVIDKIIDDIKDTVVKKVLKLLLSFLELDEERFKTTFVEYVRNREVFDTIYVLDDNYIAYEELVKNYKDGLYR